MKLFLHFRLFCLCVSIFCVTVSGVSATLPPIEVKGTKFFDTISGQEFVIKGVDYFPRPNTGDLNQNSMDYYTSEFSNVWKRDIPFLQDLGVNAIRLYAVNASLNHDEFMCALQEAGIYVVVALAQAECAITADKYPECYPPELKLQGQHVIEVFSKYSNTLAFSAGNEVNHFTPLNMEYWNAPCQKKFLRDMRKFIEQCEGIRRIPVGLVSADTARDDMAHYYNCHSAKYRHDPLETAEWYGLNTYVFCDGNATEYEEALGLKSLQKNFASYNYSIPAVLTEFGCLSSSFDTVNTVEGQRNFYQARWMLDQEPMRKTFAGGFAFEYSIEKANAEGESPYPFKKFGKQNYGIGYFSPENCDDVEVPCDYNPLPSFEYLKEAYATSITGEIIDIDEYEPDTKRSQPSKCPKTYPALDSINWDKVDNAPNLKCPRMDLFQCTAAGTESSAHGVYMQNEDYEFKMEQLKNHRSILTWHFVLFLACVVAAVIVIKKANFPHLQRRRPHYLSRGGSEKEESQKLSDFQKYESMYDEGYGTLSSDSSSSDDAGHV